jgi:two-component system LytT family response regulator
MKIKCIAIDDEPLALKQIASYIQKTPFLELTAECESAIDAITILENIEIDLIFIDINMPDMNGMDFVKALIPKYYVVFTTAHSEYAVEGFQVDAIDYLLKPIDYSNFLKSANKVKNQIELVSNNIKNRVKTSDNHLFVKSEYRLIRIDFAEIKYIESQHEYIKIFLTNDKPIMTLLKMRDIEEQLPSEKFMRVHRSFIVNLEKVKIIERNCIIFDDKVYIPVSKQYKETFQKYISEKFA